VSDLFEDTPGYARSSMWQRRRLHRAIEKQFGFIARGQVAAMSDFAVGYYVAYLRAGFEHSEAMRLATLSAQMGDDITNYPEIAFPDADAP
jgi:hypothetical protein